MAGRYDDDEKDLMISRQKQKAIAAPLLISSSFYLSPFIHAIYS